MSGFFIVVFAVQFLSSPAWDKTWWVVQVRSLGDPIIVQLLIEIKKGPAVGQEIVTGPFKVLRQVKEGDRVIIEKEGDKKKEKPKAS